MASQLLARHWIDGEWVDAQDRVESINPATGEESIQTCGDLLLVGYVVGSWGRG